MKKNILTTLVAALVYFLCIGVGVLLGNLVDHTGNMFYAPACSALVGGSVYMILLAKVPRFGAITTIGLVISLFPREQAWCWCLSTRDYLRACSRWHRLSRSLQR